MNPECFSSRTGISYHSYLTEIQPAIEDIMEGGFGGDKLIITLEEGRETALRIASEHVKVKVESAGEHELKLSHTMTKQEIAKMVGTMIANDVVVTGFHKQEGSLESLFMRVTGESAEGRE